MENKLEQLIGGWSLVTALQSRNGVKSPLYGDSPTGQIQYTADGRMSAFLMDTHWPANGRDATEEPKSFLAYAGSWKIHGDEVHHQVEFASIPSFIGRTLVRKFKIDGNLVALTAASETTKSGAVYVAELLWRKFG